MQVLYSMEQNQLTDTSVGQKILRAGIDKAYKLKLFNLGLLVRVADLIRKEHDIKNSKFLPTEKDRQFSARLAANPLIAELRNNKRIHDVILKYNQDEEESSMVKDLLKSIIEKDEYKSYCSSPNPTADDERKILAFIFEKVLQQEDSYRQYLEDNYPECLSELPKIDASVSEYISRLPGQQVIPEKEGNQPEEVFARELLTKTMENNEHLAELIQPKLKNWDIDRIAQIDMILMKMAICELLYFDEIPVKVSINEYIDLAKIYSTSRSKDFVNGILDNIMRDLRAQNAIIKSGRGLVE